MGCPVGSISVETGPPRVITSVGPLGLHEYSGARHHSLLDGTEAQVGDTVLIDEGARGSSVMSLTLRKR